MLTYAQVRHAVEALRDKSVASEVATFLHGLQNSMLSRYEGASILFVFCVLTISILTLGAPLQVHIFIIFFLLTY